MPQYDKKPFHFGKVKKKQTAVPKKSPSITH